MTSDEKKRRQNRRYGKIAALVMRIVTSTMRMKVIDHCGFLTERPKHSLIHALWHNAIFSWPSVYRRNWDYRSGAALTSASKDGEVVAGALKSFGISPVRGSNSRRGVTAIIELKKWLKNGYDIAITPDGPRGPKQVLQPGIILLAQKTKAPILVLRFVYHNCWRLNTWDQFQIPKPFSRVDVHIGPYIEIPEQLTEEAFEEARLKVEQAMSG